jgi:hypothetical protein
MLNVKISKVVYSGFFCLRYFELKFDPNRPSLDDAVGSLLGSRTVFNAVYRYPPKSAGAFLPKHLERAFYRHKRSAVKRDVRDKVRHPHTHKNRLRSSPRHKGVTLPVLPPEPTPSPPQRIRKMLSHPPSPPRKRKDQPKRKERKSSFPHTSDHL